MSAQIMPRAPDIEWWRKLTAKVEIGWQLGPNAIYPARKWFFDCEGGFRRQYKGYRVFWLRGWVRILGIEVGAGVFWRGPAIADQSPEGRDPKGLDAKHASGGAEGNRPTPSGIAQTPSSQDSTP